MKITKRKIVISATMALIILFFATQAVSAQAPYWLSGHVYNSTGAPVPDGITVYIKDTTRQGGAGYVNTTGTYHSGGDYGRYRADLNAHGFIPNIQDGDVFICSVTHLGESGSCSFVLDRNLNLSQQCDIHLADTTLPKITNVTSTDITNNSATITWTTDEPSDSRVKYGTTSGSYTLPEEYNATDDTSHSVALTGLKPYETYYYVVNSTDPSGNSNQTIEYSFRTKEGAETGNVVNGSVAFTEPAITETLTSINFTDTTLTGTINVSSYTEDPTGVSGAGVFQTPVGYLNIDVPSVWENESATIHFRVNLTTLLNMGIDKTEVKLYKLDGTWAAQPTTYHGNVSGYATYTANVTSWSYFAIAPPAVVTSIVVSPLSATLNVGETETFTAKAYDNVSVYIPGIIFTWTSSDTTVGTITQTGLFTAKAPGSTTITATNGTVSGTASVTVRSRPRGGGRAPPAPAINVPLEPTTGAVTSTTTFTVEKATLTIPAGVIIKDAAGNPLSTSITTLYTPTTAETVGAIAAYDFGPSGTTFSPSIDLVIEYDPADIPAGFSESDLVIRMYDGTAKAWIDLDTTVDTAANTATAKVSHFTTFALFATAAPTATPTPTIMPTAAPTATPTPTPTPLPAKAKPWGLIIGIIIAVVIVGAAAYYFYTKKKA